MKRVHAIDFLRGLVMLIMAIDHTRDFLHVTSATLDPTDLSTTTVGLFLTRWITHLCAPTFVFLSGTSAYFSVKSQQNLSKSRRFLLTRGIWLIGLEFTLINFALWFDVHFRTFMFQVIAAIGFGFIILSLLLRVKPTILSIVGLGIIALHNLIPRFGVGDSWLPKLLTAVWLRPDFISTGADVNIIVSYPIIPWLGIMLAGYGFGALWALPQARRRQLLWQIGTGVLVLFVGLRWLNLYGDPVPWASQQSMVFTFLSFINITKYPPSLLYTLLTLGISILVLAWTDGRRNAFSRLIEVYGRVPLFYYLVHWYVLRVVMFGVLFAQGFGPGDFVFSGFNLGRPNAPSGVALPVIYLLWVGIITLMYFLCRWYDAYKASHRHVAWLRYL